MAPSRRQPIKDAPRESRERLGYLLQVRREDDLGYGYESRPAFEEQADVNRRMASDVERARRDTFDINTLRFLAEAYEVTVESMIEVAWGRADKLTPARVVKAPPAAARRTAPQPVTASSQDSDPLFGDEAQVTADRPYAEEIHGRLRQLERRGITAEAATGEQVFPRPGEENDARFWDQNIRDMWDLERRIWMAARVRREQAARRRDNLPGAS